MSEHDTDTEYAGEVSGLAGFVLGESAEILNLLNERESGAACACGGNCCGAA